MKKIYNVFVILLVLFSATNLFAQAASITWPLTSTQNPNAPIGNIQGSLETIGIGSPTLSTGVPANQMSIYGYNSFNNSGQELWVGNQGGTWVPDPPAPATPLLDPSRYAQFNVAPTAGNNFTVNNISFKYGDDNNGFTNFNILAFKASYSFNGFQTETFLNTNPLVYLNLTMSTFTAQNLNVLVPSGQTFSLRIYMYPILHGIAMARTFAIHKDVIIEGTTSPVVVNNGSICGMKFNDLNGNGLKDDGELGLPSWTINLSMGAVQTTATTDANGEYCFNNLPLGTYTITEVNKPGWQQTTPTSPGSHTVELTSELNIIGINFGNKEILDPSCTDFENSSLSGWQANNTSISIQQNGNNHFIQTTDQSGPSSFFNSSKSLIGNWTNLFANGCGSLCFDVSFLYGGNPYNGVNPPQTFVPYIVIQGGGFSAGFVTNNPISVGDGWHSYCAPLSYLNSDGTLPSNSDGHWVMSVGTANDWNTLLSNVTSVRLPVDPTSYQSEKFGFDNICLKNTGDCNSPLKLGSICGIKIHDKNGDGVKDSNEDGIPNWTINLSNGTTTISTTTDASGNYCFNDLPAGFYTVSEANQPNWRQIFPIQPGNYSITLTAGQIVNNINFSNVEDPAVQLGSICGIKFNDINSNGVMDLNEPGLPNWQFNLTGAANLTATTDLRGNFCFSNLRTGSYTVQEVIQNGWEPTVPNITGTFNVTLLPGQNISEVYFGNKEILGSICGIKYNDLNGNGSWDTGEPGLPNWQITLSSFGHTSSGLSSGPTLDLIGTVTTDQNGNYCFSNLKQGSYLMGEVMQSGWKQTEPATSIYGITLSSGQEIQGLNFGNKVDVTVRLGSICGVKFNDKNGNGVQDLGEPGIADWQIQLGGPIDMTVVTDKNGNYCFNNLIPGEYKVGEVMRTGWRQTLPSTNFYNTQLASGQSLTNINFGNKEDATVQLSSICGIKFNDKNGNGRQDAGELGIPNWNIYLTGTMNLTATTDDRGNYCFTGLIQGRYSIREENKTGWRQTAPSSETYSFEIGNGENFKEINFGNKEDATVVLGSICGIKFNDLNGNGTQEPNEPGIANWTISLTGAANLTTTTDLRGKFCFDKLKMGNYIVSEVYRDGWTQTAPSTGSYSIVLTEDRNPDDLYFGNKEDANVRLGSICGIKFNDKNGNGIQDTGESGIPDWQINLGGSVDMTIKTDKGGKYCFDNLKPGEYIIKEEMQTSWTQTFPASPGSYSVILTSGQSLKDYNFGNKYEPQIGCVQPPKGMVAWWSLDESYHSKWFDLAGYNNFGTLMNGPIPVAAKVLGGLQFDGIDDYVEVADHSELNFGTGDFSFDAWIKTNAADGVRVIIDKRTETSGLLTIYQGYSIFLNEGKLHLQIANGAFLNSYTNYGSPVLVADGNWHHVAITVSRTNTQGIIFYVDGAPIQFGNPTGYQGSLTNTSSLRIGSQSFSGVFSGIGKFKGIIDEVELFNRVLTQAEIVSIFNAGSSGKCKPNGSVSSVWGHVFHDLNFDGVINDNDTGLTNWVVFLNGPTIATNYTDMNGNFSFTDLKPGNYTISVVNQNNWFQTHPQKGNYSFELESGQSLDAINFGFANDPCLSGSKTWSSLGTGTNGQVNALAVHGGKLYVGGYFSTAGGILANNIAQWDGTNWSALGSGINGIVYSLTVIGDELYVGGSFTSAGNVSAKNIAKLDIVSSIWFPLGNGTNETVLALTATATSLYAGGQFTTAGSVNANRIAKWDGSNWSALGSGIDADVVALAVNGSTLYAGGFFNYAGSVYARKIAQWNGSSWSGLGNGVADQWGFGSERVRSLAVRGSVLYVGGNFVHAGNASANFIAKWDIMNSSWSALGSGISSDDVWAIAPSGTDALYVGGQFSTAGNLSANRVSKWDDTGINWSALGTGISGNYNVVTSLVEMGGALYAGGSFSNAGGINANNIAKYSCSGTTTSVDEDNSSNIIPQQFQLSQNYPNPFNPTSRIRYDLPKASFVKISVYDILGREIRVLVNEEKSPGVHEVNFDAKYLASGIYFYTIRTKDFTQSKKMILMK